MATSRKSRGESAAKPADAAPKPRRRAAASQAAEADSLQASSVEASLEAAAEPAPKARKSRAKAVAQADVQAPEAAVLEAQSSVAEVAEEPSKKKRAVKAAAPAVAPAAAATEPEAAPKPARKRSGARAKPVQADVVAPLEAAAEPAVQTAEEVAVEVAVEGAPPLPQKAQPRQRRGGAKLPASDTALLDQAEVPPQASAPAATPIAAPARAPATESIEARRERERSARRAARAAVTASVAPAETEAAEAPPAAETAPIEVAAVPAPADAPQVEPAEPSVQPPIEPMPEPVPAAVQPRWQHAKQGGAGLFGAYQVDGLDGQGRFELQVDGDEAGFYRCDCAAFENSELGHCEHAEYLLDALRAASEAQAEQLARGLQTEYSEVWLSAAAEQRLVLRAGRTAPAALRAAAEAMPEGGLEQAHAPLLQQWLAEAAAVGHELRVAAPVWQVLGQQLERWQRISHLEQRAPQGPTDPALAALLRKPLLPHQWEAALFSVCAGRALVADDLGLGQRSTAAAAIAVWRAFYGMQRISLLAPLDRHDQWRSDVQALLGAWPEQLTLLTPETLAEARGAELLIVDAVQTLASVSALRALDAPALLLLADSELLGEPLLGELVDWLDQGRAGAWAAWQREGRLASKRRQRELLSTVMLSRRRRDLGLPVSVEESVSLQVPGLSLPAEAWAQLRALTEAWSRTGFLAMAQQQRLLDTLAALRATALAPAAIAARGEALLELLPQILPERADKLVIFAQQDATLKQLHAVLSEAGLPLANLRCAQSEAVRAEELAAWREEGAQILLATDAACAGLNLVLPAVAVVHADLPWNPAQRRARVERVAGREAGVPSWQLIVEGSLDPALLALQQDRDSLPAATLDFEPAAMPFLAPEALAQLLPALQQLLGTVAQGESER